MEDSCSACKVCIAQGLCSSCFETLQEHVMPQDTADAHVKKSADGEIAEHTVLGTLIMLALRQHTMGFQQQQCVIGPSIESTQSSIFKRSSSPSISFFLIFANFGELFSQLLVLCPSFC